MGREPIEIAASITIAALESGNFTVNADETAKFLERMCDIVIRRKKEWQDSLNAGITFASHVRETQ